jgi:hypothetical protein
MNKIPRSIVFSDSGGLLERSIAFRKGGPAPQKKPRCLNPGNPAVSLRPVAFRPRLAAGLAVNWDFIMDPLKIYCQENNTKY